MTRLSHPFVSGFGLGLLGLCGLSFVSGCSSAAEDPDEPTSTAGGGATSGGAAGVVGGGAAGIGGAANGGAAGAAVAGSSGAGGLAGAGGSVGGAGGEGGVAQAGGGAGGQLVGVGVQADPGTEGDGSFTQNEPYNTPGEATALMNGAPAGQLIGPMLYASATRYPGMMFNHYIYVPAQYEAGKPAALMVFQDAPLYIGLAGSQFTTTVFDNLIHAGDMPVTIGLFTETGTADGSFIFDEDRDTREVQYSVYSDAYANFLIDEIIPDVIQSQYDIVDDPNGWAIGGQSSGGNCSLIVGMQRSDKFHKILTHNGAFDNADRMAGDVPGTAFPTAIENSELLPLRINLLSGPNDIPVTYQYNQSVVAALMAKGYHYRYIDGTAGHYPPVHAVADYPEALRWLWRGYTLPWYQQ